MTDFQRLSDEAQRAVLQGRLRTARRLYEACLERFPEHTLFAGFNLGAALQMQAGDGAGARLAYQRALAGRARSEGRVQKAGLDQLEANICENSMLLCLSFEEYESWGERLERLEPNNPILTDQRVMVREGRDRTHPWFAVMLAIAKTGYDADPAKDPGRYGASAALLQLLLQNRRELRVPREDYRVAVGSYCALAMQAWAKCGMTMEQAGGVDPDEFNFVAESAIPLVEEYTRANPADEQVNEALRSLKAGPANAPRSQPAVPSRAASAAPPAGCGAMPIGAVLGGLAGHFLLTRLPEAAAIGGGAILGALAAFQIGRNWSLASSSRGGLTAQWQTTPELSAACRAAGVQGLPFLFEYAVVLPDSSLGLRFKPLEPVAAAKQRDAYLALRALVACTYPAVVATVPGVQLLDTGIQYRIGLGPGGVPAAGFGLRMETTTLGPLQVVGEIEEDAWWVGLEPFSPDPEMEFFGGQKKLFSRLVPAWDRMKGELRLPGQDGPTAR